MELRQLKALVNIVDLGGFAIAGETLGLTQSAVSLQIKALESELGEILFDRSKRPPQPNARAMILARKARDILRMCADLGGSSDEHLSGTLLLGAVPTVQTTVLPNALKQLRNSYPELFIYINSGLSDQLIRSVRHGIIDVAIVSEPTKLPVGVSWYPFLSEALVAIMPQEFSGDVVDVLESNPYIRFKRTTFAGEFIDAELKDLGIKVKTAVETDNLNSIWEMVSCGMGVSVVPQDMSKQQKTRQIPDNIQIMPLRDKPVDLVTGLLVRTSDPKSNLINTLYKTLVSLEKNESRI